MGANLFVNLGCSDDLRQGYLNVDRWPPPVIPEGYEFLQMDLRERWKLADSSVSLLRAKDVFEHIDNAEWPGQKGIIWCMNEAHRVLIPGGQLDLTVPCLPGKAPWVDPTHVSVWSQDLRYYFCEEWNNPQGERGRLGPAYGITALFGTVGGRSGKNWEPVQYAPDDPERRKLFLTLEAIK